MLDRALEDYRHAFVAKSYLVFAPEISAMGLSMDTSFQHPVAISQVMVNFAARYGIDAQTRRAFDNLVAVCEAAGGSLEKFVRLGLYLTDLGEFFTVNAVMGEYFNAPFPARSTIEVSGLPRGVLFEVDAVMVLD